MSLSTLARGGLILLAAAAGAPAANAERFTHTSEVEFHLWLNCKHVVGRECSAGEKADLMRWLITLQP